MLFKLKLKLLECLGRYLKSCIDLVDKVFLKGKGMIGAEATEVSHAELELVMLRWSYSVMVVTGSSLV